jgi:hypothetical protein
MLQFFSNLDRRWIFLMMFLAVATPILGKVTFPEKPSPMVMSVYHAVEDLPDGSNMLMAFDYDPASMGELQPMAAAFTRHCAEKKHKLYFMTLWAPGVPMIQANIDMLKREYPDYQYGRDYVNLGFKTGAEGVIKLIVTDITKLYTSDVYGNNLDELPITRDLRNIQKMDLVVNVSAGSPGSKEWVQYAATPFGIKMVTGCTGVQAPSLYPYIPSQLAGVLGAIKAAAEYEQALINRYPRLAQNDNAKEGLRRMGPQLVAHLLMIGLIILGNVIFFAEKRRSARR